MGRADYIRWRDGVLQLPPTPQHLSVQRGDDKHYAVAFRSNKNYIDALLMNHRVRTLNRHYPHCSWILQMDYFELYEAMVESAIIMQPEYNAKAFDDELTDYDRLGLHNAELSPRATLTSMLVDTDYSPTFNEAARKYSLAIHDQVQDYIDQGRLAKMFARPQQEGRGEGPQEGRQGKQREGQGEEGPDHDLEFDYQGDH